MKHTTLSECFEYFMQDSAVLYSKIAQTTPKIETLLKVFFNY